MIIVDVTVVPKGGSFSVSVKDGKVKVHLRSPPENNKANIELVKELGKALSCEVRIVSGQKSRHKKLELGLDKEEWERYLHSLSRGSPCG